MNNIDNLIKKYFPDESVCKSSERTQIFHGMPIPSFIKDWLIKRYTNSNGTLDKTRMIKFMNSHMPQKSDDLKRRLQTDREEVQILCRMIIETDIKKDIMRFSIPDLGIKTSEGRIPTYVAKKYPQLKNSEVWGIVKLIYVPPFEKESGYIQLVDYKPFSPYKVDVEYYKDMSKNFAFEDWIDVLIRAMEYNPDNSSEFGFKNIETKLLFLSRLLIFVEPNLNMIELAPKGTGKSFVFGNLTKYGWLFSGGKVTRAKLFYDMQRKTPGIIEQYDFITFDEIETISFSDEDEMLGALKNYLEQAKFSIANYNGTSKAGLMLLGNLPLNKDGLPINQSYFSELSTMFKNSALLDRFHGFLKGWELIRVNESMLLDGFSLNVEFFSEILHKLRNDNSYACIVGELLEIPEGADIRDKKAIIKLTTGFLKLFFPWVRETNDVDIALFEKCCLNPAINMRAVIKSQIAIIDPEFNSEVPNITIKK